MRLVFVGTGVVGSGKGRIRKGQSHKQVGHLFDGDDDLRGEILQQKLCRDVKLILGLDRQSPFLRMWGAYGDVSYY